MRHVDIGFVGWPGAADDPTVSGIRDVASPYGKLVVVTLGDAWRPRVRRAATSRRALHPGRRRSRSPARPSAAATRSSPAFLASLWRDRGRCGRGRGRQGRRAPRRPPGRRPTPGRCLRLSDGRRAGPQRMKKPRNTSTTPAMAIAAADPRLPAQELHRDGRAGLAVIADTTPPRLVAGDVLVLGLERLVAAPRPAGPLVPDDDQGDPGAPQQRGSRSPTRQASGRSRPGAPGRRSGPAPRWPGRGMAFMTWPTRNPTAWGLPA